MNKQKRAGWQNPASAKNGKAGGRPPMRFIARKGEQLIVERSSLTMDHPAIVEIWQCLSVSEGGNTIEFQIGNDIITIRRPSADD